MKSNLFKFACLAIAASLSVSAFADWQANLNRHTTPTDEPIPGPNVYPVSIPPTTLFPRNAVELPPEVRQAIIGGTYGLSRLGEPVGSASTSISTSTAVGTSSTTSTTTAVTPTYTSAVKTVTDTGPVDSSPSVDLSTAKPLNITDFGGKGDGVTDNTEALRKALAAAKSDGAHQLVFPAGTFLFQPIGTETGFHLPSNFVLNGAGADATTLVVAGTQEQSTYASFFWIRNQDNVEIHDIGFRGNGKPIEGAGSAIQVVLDKEFYNETAGTPRSLSHFVIHHAKFHNFAGEVWIRVQNYHDSFTINDVQIRDNNFVSEAGNAFQPENIGRQASAITMMGSLTSPNGLITKAQVSGNSMDLAYMKNGVTIFSGVQDVKITGNNLHATGLSGEIQNDRGAYAILIYNNAYYMGEAGHKDGDSKGGIRPDMVYVDSNIVDGVRSCGVYVAAANHVYLNANHISGQIDTENGTLPKGGISLNQPLSAVVTDNIISNSFFGISIVGSPGAVTAKGNTIENISAGGTGAVLLTTAAGTGTLQFYEAKISASPGTSTTGIRANFSAGDVLVRDIVEVGVQTPTVRSGSGDTVSFSRVFNCGSYAGSTSSIGSSNLLSQGCSAAN